jgi:hypothetical protein
VLIVVANVGLQAAMIMVKTARTFVPKVNGQYPNYFLIGNRLTDCLLLSEPSGINKCSNQLS